MIITPKLVALDTSTLAKASNDYWRGDTKKRSAVTDFVGLLSDTNVVIALSLTHILELFAHDHEQTVSDRFDFLRLLPQVAWIRPYDDQWFVGDMVTLAQRELHTLHHAEIASWEDICERVREEAWQTGVGDEMFVKGNKVWDYVKLEAKENLNSSIEVASVARTDASDIMSTTLGELRRLPRRNRSEQATFLGQFAKNMSEQLATHGDKRLASKDHIARSFAQETYERIGKLQLAEDNFEDQILSHYGIPNELTTERTTVGEVGDLAVLQMRYKSLGRSLKPPIDSNLSNTCVGALPTVTLENELSNLQREAHRVSGSDMGDSRIASLAFYADYVEVDKRTRHYVDVLSKKDPRFSLVRKRLFTAANRYNEIIQAVT